MSLTPKDPQLVAYDASYLAVQPFAIEAQCELEKRLLSILELTDCLQNASQEDHDAIKAGAQALKKLCRVRTNLSWKEWRVSMEAQRSASLQVCLSFSIAMIEPSPNRALLP